MSSSNGLDVVEIVLDGEVQTLTPTFGAAKMISSRFGGIQPVLERVARLELEVVADIIALGLGYLPPDKPPKDLIERVWQTGLTDDTGGLAGACANFLMILASGGKLPSKSSGPDQGDAPEADPQ